MKTSETLTLDALQPGMVICDPVLDPAGRILVPVGTVINEMTIVGLRRRDVASVRVECEVAESAAERELAQQHTAPGTHRLRDTFAQFAVGGYRLPDRRQFIGHAASCVTQFATQDFSHIRLG